MWPNVFTFSIQDLLDPRRHPAVLSEDADHPGLQRPSFPRALLLVRVGAAGPAPEGRGRWGGFVWGSLCLPDLDTDLNRETAASEGCFCFLFPVSLHPWPGPSSEASSNNIPWLALLTTVTRAGPPSRRVASFLLCLWPSFYL